MPRRRRIGKQRVAELTEDQEWELELGPRGYHHGENCQAPGHRRLPAGVRELHPDPEPAECSWFASPAEREIAWWLHRERLLAVELGGDRPWAYFEYELREHPPWPPGPAAFLAERGLLSGEEQAEILTWSDLYSYPD